MTNYQVVEWMTPNPISITPKTTLSEAHRLMRDHKVRRLPVTKDHKLVGIVTLGDVLEAEPSDATTLSVYEINALLDTLTVDHMMTTKVITIAPHDSIRDAASIMLSNKISGIPVVDNGRLVGIITESDIFRMLVREMEPT
jgi:CBS domain-containing protein